jgi:hypothetical protein
MQSSGSDLRPIIEESVARWLTMLERNRGTWIAAIGMLGQGRDPEVEQILDEAREQAVDRLVEAVRPIEGSSAPNELRAVIRSYSGFAEAASLEWLLRERLSREQVQTLLVEGFLTLVQHVLPAVERVSA